MQNCEAIFLLNFLSLHLFNFILALKAVVAHTPVVMGFSYHHGLVEFCSYFDRWSSQSLPKEISFCWSRRAGASEERSVYIRTCARTAKIRKCIGVKIVSWKSIFIAWKSRWLIPRSYYIGDFVLVIAQLSFYYSTILRLSLAFFREECTLPTTLEIGKVNNN